MKKVALALVVFVASATLADAVLLVNESFSYPDGPLVTESEGVWVHHSGSVDEVMVSSGRVLVNEANTEDVNVSLAGQPYLASGTTNVFYASFTVRFTTLPGSGGTYHFLKETFGRYSWGKRPRPKIEPAAAPISRISRIQAAVFGRGSGR